MIKPIGKIEIKQWINAIEYFKKSITYVLHSNLKTTFSKIDKNHWSNSSKNHISN